MIARISSGVLRVWNIFFFCYNNTAIVVPFVFNLLRCILSLSLYNFLSLSNTLEFLLYFLCSHNFLLTFVLSAKKNFFKEFTLTSMAVLCERQQQQKFGSKKYLLPTLEVIDRNF